MKKRKTPPRFDITGYPPELKNQLDDFSTAIESEGLSLRRTHQAQISDQIYAEAPGIETIPHLVYSAYQFVLDIPFIEWGAKVVGEGVIGGIGYDQFRKRILPHLKNIILKTPPNKDVLLVKTVPRFRQSPLRIGFALNSSLGDSELQIALNQIPDVLKWVSGNLTKITQTEIAILSYDNANHSWDLSKPKLMRTNKGTTSLQACRVSKLYGHVPEDVFNKYVPEAKTEWEYSNFYRPPEMNDIALNYRTGYYQRLYTTEHIIGAINTTKAAMVSVDIYPSFLEAPKGAVPIPAADEKRVGGHCVSVIGYENGKFKFQNSWGKEWGDNGFGYLPKEYIEPYLIEAWAQSLDIAARNNSDTKTTLKEITLADGSVIKYEHKTADMLRPGREILHVLNFYNPDTPRKYAGWAHLIVDPVDSTLTIEEVYQDHEFPAPLYPSIFLTIEMLAMELGLSSIKGFISVLDCPDEFSEAFTVDMLEHYGYAIEPNTSQFRGCLYEFTKILSKNN